MFYQSEAGYGQKGTIKNTLSLCFRPAEIKNAEVKSLTSIKTVNQRKKEYRWKEMQFLVFIVLCVFCDWNTTTFRMHTKYTSI